MTHDQVTVEAIRFAIRQQTVQPHTERLLARVQRWVDQDRAIWRFDVMTRAAINEEQGQSAPFGKQPLPETEES